MTGTNMTISEQILLEKCREIELLCKDLYSCLADINVDDENVARLWLKTAMEEQNHAEQFTLALKLRKGMSCKVVAELSQVDNIITHLHHLISKVKTDPPSPLNALKSAIKLENYLKDFHLSCVVMFEDDSFKKLFEAMMQSDQEHIGSLQEACEILEGVQEWTFTG